MVTEKGPLIARGHTADIFAWKNNQVLKLFQDWIPAITVEREAYSTQAVYDAGIPVPAVEGVVEVEGRWGIIFERVKGPLIFDVLKNKPWQLFRLAHVMAALQATIHSYEIPELLSQRQRLEWQIRDASLLSEDMRESVLNVLAQLPDANAVCHGDFHPMNIIMSPRGPIIIDWLDTTRGNPLADVARTWLLTRQAVLSHDIHVPTRWLFNPMRSLLHSVYLRHYLKIHPASRKQIQAWQLPVIAGRLSENLPDEYKARLLEILKAKLQQRNG